MSLIRKVSSTSDIRGTGVFILREHTPRARTAPSRKAIGIVANCGWGPLEEVYTPNNAKDLIARHFPLGPDATGVIKQISNLEFGQIKFWRVSGTTPVKAVIIVNDNDPAPSLRAIAREYGADGNRFKIDVIANAGAATSRDVRVYGTYTDSVGSVIFHDETYLLVQDASGVVTDPGDPFVLLEQVSGADEAAVVGTYTLVGGSSGTVAASDALRGLEAFSGDTSGVECVIVCGFNGAEVAVNAVISAWSLTNGALGKIGIGCTEAAVSKTDIISDIAALRSESYRQLWPRVSRTWTYNYAGISRVVTETMDGNAAYACMVQRNDPWSAVFLGNAQKFATSLKGLEAGYDNLDSDGYADLDAAGVIGWYSDPDFGTTPLSDVTSYLEDGAAKTGDLVRYDNYVIDVLSRIAKPYLSKPLDITLPNGPLGFWTQAQIGAMTAFFEDEASTTKQHIIASVNDDGSASPSYAIDPFSEATNEDIGAGRWTIAIAYRKTAALKQSVLKVESGTTLNITTA